MQGLLAGLLVLSVTYFGGKGLLQRFFFRTGYVYAEETERAEELQEYVTQNKLSASDYKMLKKWGTERNIDDFTISRGKWLLFDISYNGKIMYGSREIPNLTYPDVYKNDHFPDLMKLMDEKKLGFTTAVELSYIGKKNQNYIAVAIDSQQSSPSQAQAKRMRELDEKKLLNGDVIDGIMMEDKKEVDKVILTGAELSKYFGKETTPRETECPSARYGNAGRAGGHP